MDARMEVSRPKCYKANDKGVEGNGNTEDLPLSQLKGLGHVVSSPTPNEVRKRGFVHSELESAHVETTSFILNTSVTYRQRHQSVNYWQHCPQ